MMGHFAHTLHTLGFRHWIHGGGMVCSTQDVLHMAPLVSITWHYSFGIWVDSVPVGFLLQCGLFPDVAGVLTARLVTFWTYDANSL